MNFQRFFIATIILGFVGLQGIKAQNELLTTGGDISGSGGSVAFSIGQTVYTNYEGVGGRTSLGVQQPYVIVTGINEPDKFFSANIYPNPANSSIQLKLEKNTPVANLDNLAYSLYDINGRLVISNEIVSEITSIPIGNLSNALYLLRVTRDNAEILSFKIFKTN